MFDKRRIEGRTFDQDAPIQRQRIQRPGTVILMFAWLNGYLRLVIQPINTPISDTQVAQEPAQLPHRLRRAIEPAHDG